MRTDQSEEIPREFTNLANSNIDIRILIFYFNTLLVNGWEKVLFGQGLRET